MGFVSLFFINFGQVLRPTPVLHRRGGEVVLRGVPFLSSVAPFLKMYLWCPHITIIFNVYDYYCICMNEKVAS